MKWSSVAAVLLTKMLFSLCEGVFPLLYKVHKPGRQDENPYLNKKSENTLLAGHTSVINFRSSFVSEYVWAHMLDYKAMWKQRLKSQAYHIKAYNNLCSW